MSSNKKERRELGKQLAKARSEQKELVARVERARAKLDKRNLKLNRLEKRIVEIQQQLNQDASADGEQKPRRTALLIMNPQAGINSGSAHGLEDIISALRGHGIEAEIGIKTSGKAVREMAKDAADKGMELVIVAGGDGTIEDVATQLMGTQTTLGILPLGTMNNLAHALGIPQDLQAACALIGAGVPRRLDLGHIKAHEQPQVEYFMETAAVGLTAIAFPAGQAVRKGRLAGLPAAIQKLLNFKASPVLVELDGGVTVQSQSQLITISNAPLIGFHFAIAPDAKMDDGMLDLAVYDEMNKAEILTYFMAITNGKPADNPKIRRYRSSHIRVRSARHEPIVSDKDELEDKQDFEVEILPGALSVIVGDGVALSSPSIPVPDAAVVENKQGEQGQSLLTSSS